MPRGSFPLSFQLSDVPLQTEAAFQKAGAGRLTQIFLQVINCIIDAILDLLLALLLFPVVGFSGSAPPSLPSGLALLVVGVS